MSGGQGGLAGGLAGRLAVPGLVLAAVLLAGCTSNPASGPVTSSPGTSGLVTSSLPSSPVTSASPPTSAAPPPVTTPSPTRTTITVTSRPPVVGPPPATAEPAPVAGTCPYLSDADLAAFNGQHTGQTQIIAVKPHPICIFYRSDGGWQATVRIVAADSPQAAVAAVNQHVPVAESDPANQPPGWSGGSMITTNPSTGEPESIYAVSKGRIAIIAQSNQPQSIKGRQIVEQVVTNLGL